MTGRLQTRPLGPVFLTAWACGLLVGLLATRAALAGEVPPEESAPAERVLELGVDGAGDPMCAFAYDYSDLLLDPGASLTVEQVSSPELAARFVPNDTRERRIDVGGGALWVRVRVRSDIPAEHVYYVWTGWWGSVELYLPASRGGFTVARSGAFVPVAERSAPEASLNRYVVQGRIPPGVREWTAYLRLEKDLNITQRTVSPAFHAELHAENAKSSTGALLLDGLAVGVLVGLGLYHLVLFSLVRERVYLFFGLAMLGRGWLFGVGRRLMLEFVWPFAPRFDFYLSWLGMPVWAFTFYLFLMSFLGTRTRTPRTHWLLVGVMHLSLLNPLLLWLRTPWLLGVDAAVRLVLAIVPLVVAAAALRRRSKEALIFLLANVLMLAYFIAYALAMLGVNVYAHVPASGFYLGILLSAALFSIAVAEQMRALRAERERTVRSEAESEVLLHRQDLEAARLAAELRSTRFEVLKSQLQPHFLFSSLDSIAALMRRDVGEAERQLALLADLLRQSLDERDLFEIDLDREVSFVTRYLEIERSRLGERLSVVVQVEPGVGSALVPCLILQPLAEDAVRRGVAPSPGRATITLRAWREGDWVHMEVRDDETPPRGQAERGDSAALAATRERLEHLYGEEAHCEARAVGEGVYVVSLRVPLRLAAPAGADAARSEVRR